MSELWLPMLAAAGEPFDSEEYLFEVKWDGVRALAACGPAAGRLWGRDRADYTARYPELDILRRLPAGTVLDGELVRLGPSGLPDLAALQARHQSTTPTWIRQASQRQPVTYVVFDLLAERGQSLLGKPLRQRRARLQALLEGLEEPRLIFSTGVVGPGRAFFEAVVAQGQEGMMAKHQASGYRPGRRCTAWRKVKPRLVLPGVVIGFVPGRHGPRQLLVAAIRGGCLEYVATVPGPRDEPLRGLLHQELARRRRVRPAVGCSGKAVWVEPELYVQLRGLGWTPGGRLRGAHLRGLLDASPGAASG